jgi:hypothetical protein
MIGRYIDTDTHKDQYEFKAIHVVWSCILQGGVDISMLLLRAP